jgi:triacylglycerol esterase/lipase EstA (alpha/beta hydrolase family)
MSARSAKGPLSLTRHLATVVAQEAIAYARTGYLVSCRARIRRNSDAAAEVGVLFVHGVGVDSSQFAALHAAIRDDADGFDAFEYWFATSSLEAVSTALKQRVIESSARHERLVVVGHSLGGLLLRMILQADDPPKVAGWVSICAPLAGTQLARLSLVGPLRALATGAPLFEQLARTEDRLSPLEDRILTIGVRRDHFIQPYTSAFLDRGRQLLLEDRGHVSSLFDPRVHQAVAELVRAASR